MASAYPALQRTVCITNGFFGTCFPVYGGSQQHSVASGFPSTPSTGLAGNCRAQHIPADGSSVSEGTSPARPTSTASQGLLQYPLSQVMTLTAAKSVSQAWWERECSIPLPDVMMPLLSDFWILLSSLYFFQVSSPITLILYYRYQVLKLNFPYSNYSVVLSSGWILSYTFGHHLWIHSGAQKPSLF